MAMAKAGQHFEGVLHPGDKGSRRSLANVLDELCLYGKDLLTDAIQLERSLGSARLAFRALRDTVDGSIRSLELQSQPNHIQLLETGQHFPLWKWPRLAQLHVTVAQFVAGSQAAIHIALPFTGQPAEILQRITTLSVSLPRGRVVSLSTEGVLALSFLLQRFSRLRCLELTATLGRDPLQRVLLRDALSSLTHLEELTISGFFLAPQSHDLVNRLRKLYLDAELDDGLKWLTLAAARLCALESVSLAFDVWDDKLRGLLLQLLRRPPPGLRSLQLIINPFDSDMLWQLTLAAGAVTEAREVDDASLGPIAEFGSTVLLRLGRPLDLLHLSTVTLDCDDEQLSSQCEQELQELRALAQSSRRVQVDSVTLIPGFDSAAALHAIQALGVLPGAVSSTHDRFSCSIDLRIGAALQTEAAAAPMVALPERDWSVMGRPELLEMAFKLLLQHLEPATAGSSSAAASSALTAGAAASNAKPELGGPSASSQGHRGRIVRLQSPFFSVLAWAPAGLLGWMRQLESKATAALASSGRGYPAFDAFLPIPSAHTVLVGCISEAAAVAVAAAARTAGCFDSEGFVQVHPSRTSRLGKLLEEAAQDFWNSGAGGSEWERLRLMLELVCSLVDESPVVFLDDDDDESV